MSETNDDQPYDYELNNIRVVTASPTPSILAILQNISQPTDLNTSNQLSLTREIQMRAREPRQNTPPDSPTIPESESESSSAGSFVEVAVELQCTLCARAPEISVQFKGCSHAACARCVKDMWWARVRHLNHYPLWFPCPWCRAEVTEVGMLSRGGEEFEVVHTVEHGGTSFVIYQWEGLRNWMLWRSERLTLRGLENGDFVIVSDSGGEGSGSEESGGEESGGEESGGEESGGEESGGEESA